MKLFLTLMLIVVLPTAALCAQSGYIEVTAPGNRQLKLAVEIPHTQNDTAAATAAAKEMADVIAFDMNMSGIVNTDIKEPGPLAGGLMFGATDFAQWRAAGYDLLVRGECSLAGDNLTVEFRLYDILNNKMMTAKRYLGKNKDLRRFAHSFGDEILLQMTGERGPFTTHIAFISTQYGNKEVAIMDWDGHNLLPLTRNGSINLNPDFSPDGREIIFTSYKRGNPDLYKRALSNTIEIPLSRHRGLNITGTWSPDGTKIALSLSKDGNAEIYTISKDGSNPQRLTVSPSIEVSPVWSPDGSHIAFVSDRLGKPQIFVMDAKGGNVRRLTTTGAYNVNPRWSPKGDKIAYARMQGGGFQIYVINADGSGDTQLTTAGSNENPAWSPDGRFIAFSSKRGGPNMIYVMRADGGSQVRVSQGKGNATQPAWSSR
ncbi:Tol-Pal system beta propeller repeat protein TolB [Geobacter sp. AOG2]|uniref:Tol-Pal system beta propeller repeat protein TolB n=1 Tax=Geobacter sp. AOG2 TaxID=1566347 RepID=UPI001CC38AE9|nr:Tol-Pal system beta propeller repeat protein TolB [Geobacter sp. AOG2]GFE59701.1 protein TolB [Geobacter sp. AOG2]